MPIPDYQTMMQPLLRFAADGNEHTFREAVEHIANTYALTEDDRAQKLSRGNSVLDNRVGWARTYLVKATLLEAPRRSVFRITERGRQSLDTGQTINTRFLRQFPEFMAFQAATNADEESTRGQEEQRVGTPRQEVTPEELIETGYKRQLNALTADVRERLIACSPEFFERLVVDLLVRMGYGGSLADAGRAIGHTGDEGIDGVIKEDNLGLDTIYIQAKKWTDRTVGRPDIQQFVGALHGQHARKGVFVTTSTFSQEARDYVARTEVRIVLIDGLELARLMIRHGVGVTTAATYELKRIDSDYFIEE